jgi:hypothetical protein
MERRSFLKWSTLFGFAGLTRAGEAFARDRHETADERAVSGAQDRRYWVALLDKIATPVLGNMSRGLLVKNMELQVSPAWDNRERRVGYMEAFLLSRMTAPRKVK